jgi:hypothetical protein
MDFINNIVRGVTFLLFLLALFLALPSPAASVKVLDLPQLVQQAEIIADVTVTNVESFWNAPAGGKAIHTRVTFRFNRPPLKGQVTSPFYLDFLGGVVGNRATKVAGMPVPAMGDRLIVFSYGLDKIFASPIIGFDQGALRVVRVQAENTDRVYRWWGQPVNELQPFTTRLAPTPANATPELLRTASPVDEFWQRISTMLHP